MNRYKKMPIQININKINVTDSYQVKSTSPPCTALNRPVNRVLIHAEILIVFVRFQFQEKKVYFTVHSHTRHLKHSLVTVLDY